MKFYMTASQNPEWKDRYSVIENDCFQSRGNAVLYDDSDWFYKKKGGFLWAGQYICPGIYYRKA